jgi:hypothetical protein
MTDPIERIPAMHRRPGDDDRIVKAAVIVGPYVYVGWRHSDIIQHLQKVRPDGLKQVSQEAQGFIDQSGYFFSRDQAAQIAHHAKQLTVLPSVLTSEDLWDVVGVPHTPG